MKHSVLVLYNLPSHCTDASNKLCAESEAGILQEVAAVTTALEELGIKHRAVGAETFADVSKILAQSPEPIVFNLVEGFPNNVSDVNYVPAVCRSFGKSFTGNDTHALSLGLDKWQSKLALETHGLPTPAGVLVPVGHKVDSGKLGPGPYIVKPIATDASEGIDFHSIVQKNGAGLNKIIAQVHEQFGQAALVEQFVGTRELNVSVVQFGNEIRVLPLAEIDFSAFEKSKPRIVGYGAKWIPESFEFNNTPRVIPAPLSQKVAQRVRGCALDAWNALGCQDYARVDFRLDEKGMPYVLEVNPNPDISPDAGFAAALEAAGIKYKDYVLAMVNNAAARMQTTAIIAATAKKRTKKPEFHRTVAKHRPAVLEMLQATEFFRPDEVEVALEVLDEAIAKGPTGHYQSFVIEDKGSACGWVCWGPTPCTLGTYDIYWIAVHPKCQAKGLGRALMDFAEKQIKASGGHLAVIETSGKEIYMPTRKFYLKIGYLESSRVWDFYAPGDDKIIYIKRL